MGTVKISKRVREEAALICAIAASNDWVWEGGDPCEQGASRAAVDLAIKVSDVSRVARRAVADYDVSAPWAEAEAMLRTGWSPDD